jgi:hypothetical protein
MLLENTLSCQLAAVDDNIAQGLADGGGRGNGDGEALGFAEQHAALIINSAFIFGSSLIIMGKD